MTKRIRVLVVDDHPLLREGLVHALQMDPQIVCVAQGGCASDAVRLVAEHGPDIAILDVNMPGSGLAAARDIRSVSPGVKVIMLTIAENEETVLEALDAGARAYVLKGVTGSDLVRTVQTVWQGESYISPGLAARLLMKRQTAEQKEAPSPDGDLTHREEQIVRRVAKGLTNKEIARELDLSEKTIKHYMTNVLQKLHVRNRVEAVLALRRRGEAGMI